MKKIFTLMIILLVIGCTNDDAAIQVLKSQGYKDINLTGWKPVSCSDSDTFATGFEATSIAGVRVSGTVCSGVLKGSTVRLD